jgi:hypothetical protein
MREWSLPLVRLGVVSPIFDIFFYKFTISTDVMKIYIFTFPDFNVKLTLMAFDEKVDE